MDQSKEMSEEAQMIGLNSNINFNSTDHNKKKNNVNEGVKLK